MPVYVLRQDRRRFDGGGILQIELCMASLVGLRMLHCHVGYLHPDARFRKSPSKGDFAAEGNPHIDPIGARDLHKC